MNYELSVIKEGRKGMRLENIQEILTSERVRERISGVRKKQPQSEKKKFAQEMNNYLKKEKKRNHYLPQDKKEEKKESEETKEEKAKIKALEIYKVGGKEEKIEKKERKGKFLDIKI